MGIILGKNPMTLSQPCITSFYLNVKDPTTITLIDICVFSCLLIFMTMEPSILCHLEHQFYDVSVRSK